MKSPIVVKQGRDYLVHIPIAKGNLIFSFSEIYRSKQSFETVMTVMLSDPTEGAYPNFQQRIDLNSASACSTLATALNGAYGNKKDGFNWILLINTAAGAIKKTIIQDRQPITFDANTPYVKDTYLIEPFLGTDGVTMIHGDGSTGKSYFCLYMAVVSALGRDFFGSPTKPFKTLYLDFEASPTRLSNRIHRICNGLGVITEQVTPFIGWYKPEGSFEDEKEVIARMIDEGKYACLIVDAGAAASGNSPLDERSVIRMYNALNQMPCPSLLIHHEPKNVEGTSDDKAYYGTTFWRNGCRLAWRLQTQEQVSDTTKVIKATHHKSNDDAKAKPFLYSMQFSEPNDSTPSITFEIADDFEPSDEQKIVEYLVGGEADVASIADQIGLTRTTVQRRITPLLETGKINMKRDGKKLVYFVPRNNGDF